MNSNALAMNEIIAATPARVGEITRNNYPAIPDALIHGQVIRTDKLPALKEMKVIPCLFPMHTFLGAIGTATLSMGHPRQEKYAPRRQAWRHGSALRKFFEDQPMKFKDFKVLQTIKAGQTVYQR